MNSRICSLCKIEKPLTEFYPAKNGTTVRPGCKVCSAMAKKAIYDANRIEMCAARRAARLRPEIRAAEVIYYEKNREKYAARQAAAYLANPERFSASRHRRRARLKGATGDHTEEQVLDLLKKQRYKCACCRQCIKSGHHKDHIVALARGGSNDIFNIQILCATCNLRKKAKDPIDFMQQNGFLI